MMHEVILLNKVHKTNEFVRIKPKITEQDLVVFARTPGTVSNMKLGGALNKFSEKKGDLTVEIDQINEYFGFSADEIHDINDSHQKQGIEQCIYRYSQLNFAFECIEFTLKLEYISPSQAFEINEWVKCLYLGLKRVSEVRKVLKEEEGEYGDEGNVTPTTPESDGPILSNTLI